MTNDQYVEAKLSESGVPVARLTWGPYNPRYPYATYEDQHRSDFADNRNYAEIPHYRVYLHTEDADEDVCEAIKAEIADMGTYIRHPTEIEDNHFVHRFDFTLVRRGE